MKEQEFEQFLHKKIPITKEMELSVIEFSPEKVKISAKLEPNLNHKGTAFGGSINSLMTVCGWAMVFANIKKIDEEAHIVVQKSSINYLLPIHNDFIAECSFEDEVGRERFFQTYSKFHKARIKLKVICNDEQNLLAEYHGQYVAFK